MQPPRSIPIPLYLVLVLLIVPGLIACASPPDLPPTATSPPLSENPTPAPGQTQPASPTATLNPIEQALATQAVQATQQVVLPRSGITLPEDALSLTSPDARTTVHFGLVGGAPYYAITRDGAAVINPSRLGFSFLNAAPLNSNLSVIDYTHSSIDNSWTQPWGEVKEIQNQHNELRIFLAESGDNPRELVIVFRAFNDGVGFRYEFPEQAHLSTFSIMAEHTEFALPGDHEAWWIGAMLDNRYEYLYNQAPISRIARAPNPRAHTPFTMRTAEGLYLSIHEAALIDYSSMFIEAGPDLVLKTGLFPWSDGVLVRGATPLKTPWRTIQIADTPGDLITSYLILNLNEPNALGDVSWVKPGKYVGIWWGMHLGKWTWSSGPGHGATTENTLAYLDFAARNGFSGVLVEGWNLGWDGDWVAGGDRFDFTTAYPDFDLEGLAAYAASLGVRLIGHHETGAAVSNYERQMEEAFALYQRLGIDSVKTGYVGYGQGIRRYDENGNFAGMEWHHGQFMVEHYHRVIETAAQYGIMINAHEPIKDTGLRRTYPNFVTREGARGQEYNAWDGMGGNPPDHVTILPFTRLLSGPMDYTPGILDLTFDQYRPDNRVNHTLAKELALYVVIYSPLQMAADLIENYEGQPAFQFILDVPADWEETRVLHAEIGDYITIVRKERDGAEWFMGSITDETSRSLEAELDFLEPGVTYVAQIYADGPGSDWQTNPYAVKIMEMLVDSETRMVLDLAPGGGQAVRFYPASMEETGTLPLYTP